MLQSRMCLNAAFRGSRVIIPQWQSMVHSSKMSTQEGVKVEMIDEKKGIAEICMRKPPVNSLDRSMLTGITEGVTKLEKDGCRAALVTSGVKGIFSGGLNLLDMYNQKSEDLGEYWHTFQEMFLRLYGSGLITVACIAGASPAAGCLVATSCDYRIMVDAPKCVIGLNETMFGLPVPHWMRLNFREVVGKRQTDLALQMGTLFPGKEALRIGLVDELVDTPQGVKEAALARLEQFLKVPDHSRKLSKRVHTEPQVTYLTTRRQEDVKQFVASLEHETTQAMIGKYIASLQSKSMAK